MQEWNGERAIIPDDFLADFRIHLIDRKIKEIKEDNKQNNNNQYQPKYYNNDSIDWIENSLLVPIKKPRRICVDLIFVPYFILVKKLSPEETTQKITEWLVKCDSLRPLNFDPKYKIKEAIKTTNNKQIPPMKKSTLKSNYKDLYTILQQKGAYLE